MYQTLFWVVVALWIGWFWGWRHAHVMVAAECERNGGFFVDKKVFKCVAVEDRNHDGWRPGL